MHQLYFIDAFLEGTVKNGVFLKLDCRYADYFLEYSNYFERALILFKSMYVTTNFGELFADELTEWLLEEGLIKSRCDMYICW